VLTWIDQHATRVEIQEIPRGARQKNRVILQYRDPAAKDLQAVGGVNLPEAVFKAAVLLATNRGERVA
jgi:hypothetical protein